ncbi:MAG: formylglycine-generating enzyme family protein [Azoarcus sp.]|nr:formylglycine-generating enzyme family protein [Azoarcus sp.]
MKHCKAIALAALAASLGGCVTWGGSRAEERENDIGMEFVLIPAGTFEMGCAGDDKTCPAWEKPRHRVTIGQPFFLGRYEVTQRQWRAVMAENPSERQDERGERPVENVSWDDAREFVRRLNEMERTGKYRLPTEAEWEYAARAGSASRYPSGDEEAGLGEYAWYRDNAHEGTADARPQPHPVGKKKPNAFGLYDMYGNVWEWVQDRFAADYYAHSPATNPKGAEEGAQRVLRGGSFNSFAGDLRASHRSSTLPTAGLGYFGLRLAFTPDEP